MNWNAFGAIGEVVGALAVVLSLVYVSIQVRAGRRALQTNTRDSVFRQVQEFNYVLMANPKLADVFQRGTDDFDSLEGDERAWFVSAMYSFFKMFENVYLHRLDGSVPPEVWHAHLPLLSLYATRPGGRAYWTHRRPVFDPRYVAVLEGMSATVLVHPSEISSAAPPPD